MQLAKNETSLDHNYTVQTSDQIPLMSSIFYLSDHEHHQSHEQVDAPIQITIAAGTSPSLPHGDGERVESGMVMSSSISDAYPSVYHRLVCEFYFNYSASYPSSQDSGMASDTYQQQLSEGVLHSSSSTSSPSTTPLSSSDYSLPVARQVRSLLLTTSSSGSSSTATDELVDLTDPNVVASTISRDRSNSQAEIDVRSREEFRGADRFNYVPRGTIGAESESKGEFGSDQRTSSIMNDIPNAPVNPVEHFDNSESSIAAPQMAEGREEPQSYWSSSAHNPLGYLDVEDKRKPPIGIEWVYYMLFGPVNDAADYVAANTEAAVNGVTVTSHNDDSQPDFEGLFGVSREHMKWLCSKLGGNNTRVTGREDISAIRGPIDVLVEANNKEEGLTKDNNGGGHERSSN